HRTVLPQKTADRTVGTSRRSYDLASGINPDRVTGQIPIQGSEIGHHAILPEERVKYLVAWEARKADNLPGLVNPECITKSSTKRAQIFHSFSLGPTKRVGRGVSGQVGYARNLSSAVEGVRGTYGTPEGAKVQHLSVVPKVG